MGCQTYVVLGWTVFSLTSCPARDLSVIDVVMQVNEIQTYMKDTLPLGATRGQGQQLGDDVEEEGVSPGQQCEFLCALFRTRSSCLVECHTAVPRASSPPLQALQCATACTCPLVLYRLSPGQRLLSGKPCIYLAWHEMLSARGGLANKSNKLLHLSSWDLTM